nr:MAG TPA: hypothetical protein [Caudoviricetes sp.]
MPKLGKWVVYCRIRLRLYLPIWGNLTQEGYFFDDPRLMQR